MILRWPSNTSGSLKAASRAAEARCRFGTFAFDFFGSFAVSCSINPHPMSNLPPVTHSVDSDGIAWIVFDDAPARANVLNPVMLAALRACLEAVAAALAGPVPAVK